MSKISFCKTETVPTPVGEATVKTTTTATPVCVTSPDTDPSADTYTPAAPATSAVAVREPAPFSDEDIGFEDIRLPAINIVQKVGPLSNIFNGGEIVLGQSLVIHEPAGKDAAPTPALELTVLGFRKKRYVEKVEGGTMGKTCHSPEEVVAAGGTLDYREWAASVSASKAGGSVKPLKYFQPLATALVFIAKPDSVKDDDHTEFSYEVEGRWYTLALWNIKGTAYSSAGKQIFTDRKLRHLRAGGYTSFRYLLTTKLAPFGTNFVYVPVLKAGAKNSDPFVAFVKDLIGAGN